MMQRHGRLILQRLARWAAGAALGLGAASARAQSAPPLAGAPAPVVRPAASAPHVPQAARDLARDEALARTDIVGDSVAADSLVGWVARRRISAGEPLRPPAIGRRPVVAAGSEVAVIASVEGGRVARSGTALTAGAIGQRIRVRLEGARIVVATVTGPAEATIP
jgi:flagella basal body P-ring formation protein FlgA